MHRTLCLVVIASLARVCNRTTTEVNAPTASTAPTIAAAPRTPPAPRHGGTVQVVGDHAVETVAARTGGVVLFFMTLDGEPIPANRVTLRSVNVVVAGQRRTVPVVVSGGAFVARTAVPDGASVAVSVPHVVVEGHTYDEIEVPVVIVVAALPGFVVVPAIVAPPVVFIGKHRKHRGWGRGGRWGWR